MRLNLIKHLKLEGLSEGEESGIPSVAVKCVDIRKNTSGRRRLSGRKLTLRRESQGERTGLDTPVVLGRKRWVLGVGGIDPFCAGVNAISTPPGEYDRKVETQRN